MYILWSFFYQMKRLYFYQNGIKTYLVSDLILDNEFMYTTTDPEEAETYSWLERYNLRVMVKKKQMNIKLYSE